MSSHNTQEFCKQYQVTKALLDAADLEYENVFHQVINNPPTTEQELREVRREKRRGGDAPKKSIFICYTNRSGSSYLSDLLTHTGICGKPQEYFTANNIERIARRFAENTLEDYIKNLAERRQSDNGIFATKTGFINLIVLHRQGLIERYFPNPYYIMLRREDQIMQAVSWYRAAYQKTWSSNHAKRAHATYDATAIAHYHELILTDARRWENYFKIENIKPFELSYEAMVSDTQNILLKMGKYLELDAPLQADPKKSKFKVQRDASNREWAERFIKEDQASLR